MGFLDFPNPSDWIESAKNGGFEREAANTVLSAVYSFWVTGMWSLGQSRFFWFLRDAATAMYISLAQLEKKGLLALTVPTALLENANVSRFQTTEAVK